MTDLIVWMWFKVNKCVQGKRKPAEKRASLNVQAFSSQWWRGRDGESTAVCGSTCWKDAVSTVTYTASGGQFNSLNILLDYLMMWAQKSHSWSYIYITTKLNMSQEKQCLKKYKKQKATSIIFVDLKKLYKHVYS